MSRMIRLGSILPATLEEFGLQKKARTYNVLTGWDAAVGEKIAAVTKPEKLERGILSVRVSSSVWRYELTMRKKEVLSKITAAFGPGQVTDIIWK